MTPLLVLNDVHLGVKRMAGTTPQSQLELRQHLHASFEALIFDHTDKDLCLNGDVFDGFEVDINDVLICYLTLSNWLAKSKRTLILAAGNHDIGKRNDKLSSFGLLADLLSDRYPAQVQVVAAGLASFGNIHVIPHCMNQDLFNIELEKALNAEPGFLLLHANVDNGFAENSDHSLNVDGAWLTKLSRRHTLLFAHEHQARIIKYDHKAIFVMGNQFPSSVADCLAHGEAQKDGVKYAHVLRDDLEGSGEVEIARIPTWHRNTDFVQLEWTDLQDTPAKFIRVTGAASAEQASDVISGIARYRARSSAFVITNAVQIDGVAGMEDLAQLSFESVKAFDVMGALLAVLEPAERVEVRELMDLPVVEVEAAVEEFM